MIARKARTSAVEDKISKLCGNLTVIFAKIEEIGERQKTASDEIASCLECRKGAKEDGEFTRKRLEREIDLSKELAHRLDKEFFELGCVMTPKAGADNDIADLEMQVAQLEKQYSEGDEKLDCLRRAKEHLLHELQILTARDKDSRERSEILDDDLELMMRESSALNSKIHENLKELKCARAEHEKTKAHGDEMSIRIEEDGKLLRTLISKNKDISDSILALNAEKKKFEKELKNNKMQGLVQTNVSLEAKVKGKAKTLEKYLAILEENSRIQRENECLQLFLREQQNVQAGGPEHY